MIIMPSSPRRFPAPRSLNGRIAALVARGDVGTRALILNDRDVLHLLKAAIAQEGTISAFAKRYGMSRGELSSILNRKRPVSSRLIKAMGMRKVYATDQ